MMLPIGYKNTFSCSSMIIPTIIAYLSNSDKANGIQSQDTRGKTAVR